MLQQRIDGGLRGPARIVICDCVVITKQYVASRCRVELQQVCYHGRIAQKEWEVEQAGASRLMIVFLTD